MINYFINIRTDCVFLVADTLHLQCLKKINIYSPNTSSIKRWIWGQNAFQQQVNNLLLCSSYVNNVKRQIAEGVHLCDFPSLFTSEDGYNGTEVLCKQAGEEMITLTIHFNRHVVLRKQDYCKLRNLLW